MNLIRRVFRSRSDAGGKESAMAENTQTTPPAIDVAAITKSVTEAVVAQLAPQLKSLSDTQKALGDNQKVLADTIAADAAKAKPPATEGPKPLTEERLTEILNGRDQQRAVSQAKSQKRADFIAKNLAKIPAAYHSMVPDSDDEAALTASLGAIRQKVESDLALMGVKAPPVGGSGTEGGKTNGEQTRDFSKVDGFTLLSEAVETETAKPVTPAA